MSREDKRDRKMMILITKSLTKSFGGLTAIDRVDISVRKGELTAIIGPNGAGKTTLFNLLTGFIKPDEGEIVFWDRDITGWKPYEINRMGVGRAFQIVNIFPRLTVLRSIEIAILSRDKRGLHLFSSARDMAKDEALRILSSVGLEEKAKMLGGVLSQGDQKRLEIGLALASQPKLLLLDEPTAGMSSKERGSTMGLIERLSRDGNLTILFTEHDMDVVFNLAQKIWVLHQGRIIFIGNQDEVRGSDVVRKVYLGEGTV